MRPKPARRQDSITGPAAPPEPAVHRRPADRPRQCYRRAGSTRRASCPGEGAGTGPRTAAAPVARDSTTGAWSRSSCLSEGRLAEVSRIDQGFGALGLVLDQHGRRSDGDRDQGDGYR